MVFCPPETKNLLEVMALKIFSRKLGFARVILKNKIAELFFHANHEPKPRDLMEMIAKMTTTPEIIYKKPLALRFVFRRGEDENLNELKNLLLKMAKF